MGKKVPGPSSQPCTSPDFRAGRILDGIGGTKVRDMHLCRREDVGSGKLRAWAEGLADPEEERWRGFLSGRCVMSAKTPGAVLSYLLELTCSSNEGRA